MLAIFQIVKDKAVKNEPTRDMLTAIMLLDIDFSSSVISTAAELPIYV